VILSLLGSGIPLHYDSDYTTIMLDWGLKTKDSGKAQLRNIVNFSINVRVLAVLPDLWNKNYLLHTPIDFR
jgi:hypothetical protein